MATALACEPSPPAPVELSGAPALPLACLPPQARGGGSCGRVHNDRSLDSTSLADFIINEYL